MQRLTKQQIAYLVQKDLPDQAVINLGIGMPTCVTEFLEPHKNLFLHSENGILGMSPLGEGESSDVDLINASKQPVTLIKGASIVDHADSFAMMRGGHLDFSVMGAFEVSAQGDLANWSLGENDGLPAVGGAMDLAYGAKQVWIMMNILTKEGVSRLKTTCSLPITCRSVVNRVYCDIGIFYIENNKFIVKALIDGITHCELDDYINAPYRLDENCSIIRLN